MSIFLKNIMYFLFGEPRNGIIFAERERERDTHTYITGFYSIFRNYKYSFEIFTQSPLPGKLFRERAFSLSFSY